MDRKIYYKYLFIIGAIWNLALSILMFILSFFVNPGLNEMGLLFHRGFLHAVMLFGIGYYLVGRNLEKNHAMVSMGMLGKILVFGYFLAYFIFGVVDITYFFTGIIDLIFAALFIEFLINFEKM